MSGGKSRAKGPWREATMAYQLAIIGGGPGGLTAALYGSRAGLKTVLIEKMSYGGQMTLTDWIENYPGFPEGISGFGLSDLMRESALKFGAQTITGEVRGISIEDQGFTLELDSGPLGAAAVIIASGASPHKLGAPGEEEYAGRGVSYCATCDGPFFRDQEIAVIGGGNTAVQEADYLTRFASRVHIVHRRDRYRAEKILVDRLLANAKVNPIMDTVLEEIKGDDSGVTAVRLKNVKHGKATEIPVHGVFMLIGWVPKTGFLPPEVKTDKQGFVITDEEMATSVPGIFAVGDVRLKKLKQIVTAAADGAIAAFQANHFLEEKGL